MEVSRAEGTASRIRREVAEIRLAADDLAAGTDFEVSVSAFLTVQATMLERAGGTSERADSLRPEQDTREDPNTFPTPARSALLIARAHHDGRQQPDHATEK
jgi:hypothetical protein